MSAAEGWSVRSFSLVPTRFANGVHAVERGVSNNDRRRSPPACSSTASTLLGRKTVSRRDEIRFAE